MGPVHRRTRLIPRLSLHQILLGDREKHVQHFVHESTPNAHWIIDQLCQLIINNHLWLMTRISCMLCNIIKDHIPLMSLQTTPEPCERRSSPSLRARRLPGEKHPAKSIEIWCEACVWAPSIKWSNTKNTLRWHFGFTIKPRIQMKNKRQPKSKSSLSLVWSEWDSPRTQSSSCRSWNVVRLVTIKMQNLNRQLAQCSISYN